MDNTPLSAAGITAHLCREDLAARLPHRFPLLLPESVSVIRTGRTGLGRVRLDHAARLWDEDTHQDLAQALVLESAAQVLGVLLAAQPAPAAGAHWLLGFDDVTFGAPLRPAQDFEVGIELERSLGDMHRARFLATQGGCAIAAGRVSVMGGREG